MTKQYLVSVALKCGLSELVYAAGVADPTDPDDRDYDAACRAAMVGRDAVSATPVYYSGKLATRMR